LIDARKSRSWYVAPLSAFAELLASGGAVDFRAGFRRKFKARGHFRSRHPFFAARKL
jgi:hypothetical protein